MMTTENVRTIMGKYQHYNLRGFQDGAPILELMTLARCYLDLHAQKEAADKQIEGLATEIGSLKRYINRLRQEKP